MKRTILAAFVAALALAGLAATASAQDGAAAKTAPKLTAEQILDKYVEVTGGSAGRAKHTSLVVKGTLEVLNAGLSGTVEVYSVAPNRMSTTAVINGFGTIREVVDGDKAWSSDPFGGTRELAGVELAVHKRSAAFDGDANWRKIWKSVELVGTQPVGTRPAYVIKLTPKDGEGTPVTNYYDAETFLLVRNEMVTESPQGTFPVTTTVSDYRDVGGVKMAFVSEQQLPTATVRITVTEATFDVKVDDARFAKLQ